MSPLISLLELDSPIAGAMDVFSYPNTTEISANPSASVVGRSIWCPKCGYQKSGKRSCCARGGDWFQNCGDVGDTKFDHTWAEGIKACEGLAGATSVKTPQQRMPHRVGMDAYPLNNNQTRNINHQHPNIARDDGIVNAGVTNSEDCVGFAAAWISAVYVISHREM